MNSVFAAILLALSQHEIFALSICAVAFIACLWFTCWRKRSQEDNDSVSETGKREKATVKLFNRVQGNGQTPQTGRKYSRRW